MGADSELSAPTEMDESAATVSLNCLNMVGWWVIYPVQHNQIRFMICLAKTFFISRVQHYNVYQGPLN